VEVLKIYEDEGLIGNAEKMGHYIEQQVALLVQRHPCIGDFRNTGLLGCLELVKNRQTKEPMAPFNATGEEMAVMNQVAGKIKQLGMYAFVRWNYVFIAPPLSITREQVDEGLAIISEALTIADAHVHE
jgi:taurine--2-oxoglutarate transaminase